MFSVLLNTLRSGITSWDGTGGTKLSVSVGLFICAGSVSHICYVINVSLAAGLLELGGS